MLLGDIPHRTEPCLSNPPHVMCVWLRALYFIGLGMSFGASVQEKVSLLKRGRSSKAQAKLKRK